MDEARSDPAGVDEHFSIVVVTWNSEAELGPLLRSLDEHLLQGYEVVVVDNASSDQTVAVAEAGGPSVRVLPLAANRGFGFANNRGIRAASRDIVVMLNPDTRLIDYSLVNLVRAARETQALCGPELLSEDGSRQPSAAPLPGGWEIGVNAFVPGALMPRWLQARCEPWRSVTSLRVGWLNGACIAAPRQVLLRLGPFDERLHLYAEDMDLGIRARLAGVPSLFMPDVARVVHLGDRSSSQRFPDAGLEMSIRNRRLVTRWRRGAIRERWDFGGQLAYHVLRYGVKRVLRRDCSREREHLTVMVRVLRASASS